MNRRLFLVTVAAVSVAAGVAFAQQGGHGNHHGSDNAAKGPRPPSWTHHPMIVPSGGFSRTAAKFQAFNMHAMEAQAYGSFDGAGDAALRGVTYELPFTDSGAISLNVGENGGYYLVTVRGHGPKGEEAAATTVKYFSNPAPPPRNLLVAKRAGFEIVPDALPREHRHYRENESWIFRVSMNGEPAADLPVEMETSNGTTARYTTDKDGRISVTFPEDMEPVPQEKWRHGRPPSSHFVLAVRNGGLLATFNGTYNRDAFAGKSVWAGIGFAALGMIIAVPFVRRRKQ